MAEDADIDLTSPIEQIAVPSSDPDRKPYVVTRYGSGYATCTCPGFAYRRTCRHLLAKKPLEQLRPFVYEGVLALLRSHDSETPTGVIIEPPQDMQISPSTPTPLWLRDLGERLAGHVYARRGSLDDIRSDGLHQLGRVRITVEWLDEPDAPQFPKSP